MDLSKILSNSAVSTLRSIFGMAGGIVTIPIITRFIGESEYGIWVTMLAIVGVFAPIGGSHLYGSLIRFTPTEDKTGQTFADSLILVVITGGIVTASFLIISFKFNILPYGELSSPHWKVVLSMTLLIYVTILFKLLSNYPRSRERIVEYEIILTIEQSIYVIALPFTFYYTRDIITGVWVLAVLKGIIAVGLLIRYYPIWVVSPQVDQFSDYFRYALPMIPKSFSEKIFTHADKYLLLVFISPTATAIYSVVYQITTFFRTMTSVLNPTLYPSVTAAWEAGEIDELQALYNTIFRGYVILTVPALAGLSLLAIPILELISTPLIANEGAILVPIIGFGFLVYGAENPLAYILTANKDTDRIAIATVSTAIFNVGLNIILIPIVGLFGAVIATVAAQVLKTTYILYRARSIIPFEIPMITLIKASTAAGVMLGVLLLLPINNRPNLRLIIYPVIGAIIYGTTLVAIRGIRIQELQSILRMIRTTHTETTES